MAKKSSIVKYRRSRKLIEMHKEKHTALVKELRNPEATDEDRMATQKKLARINKRAFPVRLRNRCELTGRSRGFYRKFRLSRMKLRELAHRGLLPGVAKASW
jgi:small subunit ribosomal protein S14